MSKSEFLAYYESSVGTYMPILVGYKPDGSEEFSEIKKKDLERLPDSFNNDITSSDDLPGGWLYKNSGKVGVRDNWQRRYMIFRGSYLFYFQNPKTQTPIGIIPLENCEIHTPGAGAKSFTESSQVLRNDNGYEFEIRHNVRNKIHLYASTEEERDRWTDMIQDRTGLVNGVGSKDSHKSLANVSNRKMQNISITRTRLLAPIVYDTLSQDDDRSVQTYGIFAPPPPPSSGLYNTNIDQYNYSNNLYDTNEVYHQPQNMNVQEALAVSRQRDEELKKEAKLERLKLQKDLESKIIFQQEGRKREAEARERSHNHARIELARVQEKKNPMTLAEMFRFLLSFANEDLSEDPDEDSPLQFPHLKGHWAENMLSNIYRSYCKSTGFMSLEEFVEFLEDTAVLHTHVPHDELDEPLADFQSQLDPVRLLSTVPRNLGYSDADMDSGSTLTVTSDNFRLNFAQFYQILLRITHVVYADLYEKDPSRAFNKFLQESILPLSCWSKGHHKRGSIDTLVTDERIVLLLMTYSPNLWRVFLSYAQDCNAKVPSISQSVYPETAKTSEKVLFGIPTGAPNDHEHQVAENSVGLFMTEASCFKFCQDYGLMPHLMNRNETKDLIYSLNREKTVLSRPKLKVQKPPTVFFQKTQATIVREQLGTSMKTRNFEKPMHFSAFDSSRPPPKTKILPQRLTNPIYTLEDTGGLGFSEFIELIAKIALDGMEAESYNVLFPTPFSKVLAMLSVWGVADLKKLEEVRLINSIES